MSEDKPTFKLKVFSPFETFYEGNAYVLSGVNKSGPFDILPEHANFITLLPSGSVTLQTPFGNRVYSISRGILKVTGGVVTLFANV